MSFAVSGRKSTGWVSYQRHTIVDALDKADKLIRDGYTDVAITAPEGTKYSEANFESLSKNLALVSSAGYSQTQRRELR